MSYLNVILNSLFVEVESIVGPGNCKFIGNAIWRGNRIAATIHIIDGRCDVWHYSKFSTVPACSISTADPRFPKEFAKEIVDIIECE